MTGISAHSSAISTATRSRPASRGARPTTPGRATATSGGREGPDWLDVDSLLALLDESRRSAVRRYVELVDGPDDDPTEDLDLPADDSRSPPQVRAPAPTVPDPVVSEIPLDELLETVARDGGLTLGDLRGRPRGGEIAAARCRAACLARRLFRIPVRRVAMRLGRDDSSFARPLPQLESRLELDPALQATIDRLTRLSAPPPLPNQKSGLTQLHNSANQD
jgi:hypothetical protein